MSFEVTMPQMGESVVEGTVTKWLVKPGDQVSEDQPLCEISTDKVDTEIPSPGAGVVAKLIAAEGQTLPVGAPLAVIESATAAAPQSQATPPESRRTTAPAEAPSPTDHGNSAGMPAAPIQRVVAAPQPREVASPPAPAERRVEQRTPSASETPPRRYSPVVLRMAEEHGIDLNLVPGTGLGGRVSKRDIERYLDNLRTGAALPAQINGAAAQPQSPAAISTPVVTPVPAIPASTPSTFKPPVYQPREGDTVEPFSRRRKLIAEHMVYSKTHSPHVGTVAEMDLSKLVALREAHKDEFRKREGFALTLLPFAAMATVRALREYPQMNSTVAGDSLVVRREINLGVAMDAEEGLLVPVIKRADTFTVTGLAREIERLHAKIRERAISADDLAGGSFTLSNPGREGNLYGFAIINQPQVGILRMGELKKRPVVIELDGNDAIAIRPMMFLALSYDHRVIDGVLGNRFLYRTARFLEEADFEL
jgi:2-oxoglutarate dehydrogenase E2 component (dihydrolipoamide succinyltransferase)